MTREEVLGKLFSIEMVVKYSKHIKELAQGNVTTTEPQVVTFKAISKKEEGAPKKELPDDPSKLHDEEIIIKNFWQILKTWKEKVYKPQEKMMCYKCGKTDHSIAQCSYGSDDDSE